MTTSEQKSKSQKSIATRAKATQVYETVSPEISQAQADLAVAGRALGAPDGIETADMLPLQRTVGNQRIQRLLIAKDLSGAWNANHSPSGGDSRLRQVDHDNVGIFGNALRPGYAAQKNRIQRKIDVKGQVSPEDKAAVIQNIKKVLAEGSQPEIKALKVAVDKGAMELIAAPGVGGQFIGTTWQLIVDRSSFMPPFDARQKADGTSKLTHEANHWLYSCVRGLSKKMDDTFNRAKEEFMAYKRQHEAQGKMAEHKTPEKYFKHVMTLPGADKAYKDVKDVFNSLYGGKVNKLGKAIEKEEKYVKEMARLVVAKADKIDNLKRKAIEGETSR